MDNRDVDPFDLTQQEDELQALQSIYPDEFSIIDPDRRY